MVQALCCFPGAGKELLQDRCHLSPVEVAVDDGDEYEGGKYGSDQLDWVAHFALTNLLLRLIATPSSVTRSSVRPEVLTPVISAFVSQRRVA